LSKKTVEFRQHEGTVDDEKVENCIRFCVGVVEAACRAEFDFLETLSKKYIDDTPEDTAIGEVLEVLGMEDIAAYSAGLAAQRKVECPDVGAVEIRSIVSPTL
jgi:hypothetical protein